MQDWLHFTDLRFGLGFQYPEITHQGHFVEWTESEEKDFVRVHFRSKDSREVYFEITNYQDLSAQMEYQRHKENLEKRPEGFSVTDLKAIRWMSQPAYEYSIKWSQAARVAMLIEAENITYRILYDPYSPVNVQILLTLQWRY